MKVKDSRENVKIDPSWLQPIRDSYATGEFTYKQLAENYNVSISCIRSIIKGITHKGGLIDDEGWPIVDQGVQIRVLKSKVHHLEENVRILNLQMWHVRKTLGLTTGEMPSTSLPAKRWVEGVDTHSVGFIEFMTSEEGLEIEALIANGEIPSV